MNTTSHQTACQAAFLSTLPHRPYCANKPSDGISPKFLNKAIDFEHIQPNYPTVITWLNFDVDTPGAYYSAEDANLATPNVVCENPKNGHAHLFYRLKTPVSVGANSRFAPIRFLEAIQRGYTHRLCADRAYCGLISKNPLHPKWRTEWTRLEPYSMQDLDDFLFYEDKRFTPKIEETAALGRNCALFEVIRKEAYRRYTKTFDPTGLKEYLLKIAVELNCQFATPLPPKEVNGIVISVVKWVRKHFTKEGLSRTQALRGSKPWKRDTLTKLEPWKDEGVSRRTWERHRAQAALLSDMDTATQTSLTENDETPDMRPWEKEGISRATWYRRKAKNKT